ncbi:hypothetical protein [Microbulbifer harenosus]|uniref:Uncharacterized protein n=1 Tax=Microbulbifer harenosus TaxID=2576840 RepID=A0ABY2UHL8_9GAMM|nr:hypothetical protein [Microbulbifer harenosus]TLM77335.1 hypothetical protein FDY93_10420 [Microbulbifer harenosus]
MPNLLSPTVGNPATGFFSRGDRDFSFRDSWGGYGQLMIGGANIVTGGMWQMAVHDNDIAIRDMKLIRLRGNIGGQKPPGHA